MLTEVLDTFIPVLMAVVLHEVAHGYAALKLGDDTAYRCGRLSLNPIQHIDMFGTVILPLILWQLHSPFLFGWAKPVPVNFGRLRNIRRDTVIVASAGVVVNAILAILAVLIFKIMPNTFCANLIMINLALIFLNILPFPPLDGSKMLFGWINRGWARRYMAAEREGMIAVLILIVGLPVVAKVLGFSEFDPLGQYMETMFNLVLGE